MFKKNVLSLYAFSKRIHQDSLYRNSIYLIASQIALAGLGFIFWIINARLFSPSEVGLATTLISITGTISSFSALGFNVAIVRYLPEFKDKRLFVNTAYAVVSLAALILTMGFLIGLPYFSPPLLFILQNKIFTVFLLIFMVVASLNAITDNVFIAYRSTHYILIVGVAVGLMKIVSPIFLKNFGSIAVFYSFATGVTIGLVLSFIFLGKFKLNFSPNLNRAILSKVWKFSLGYYIASIVGMVNAAILPVLITNTLDSKTTAYYYMPTMILSLMQAFPRSMGSSMLAEGSQNPTKTKFLFFKSMRGIYAVMIPATIVLMFVGQYILLAFGKSYSTEGIIFLRLTLLSLLISVPNYLLGTILSLQKRIYTVISLSVFNAVIGVSITLLMLRFGLTGLGLANILNQLIYLLSLLILLKNGYISFNIATDLMPTAKKLSEL